MVISIVAYRIFIPKIYQSFLFINISMRKLYIVSTTILFILLSSHQIFLQKLIILQFNSFEYGQSSWHFSIIYNIVELILPIPFHQKWKQCFDPSIFMKTLIKVQIVIVINYLILYLYLDTHIIFVDCM